MTFLQPHFVRDYRRLVRQLARQHDPDRAMELAVGGSYHAVGRAEHDILRDAGLASGHFVVDVGCGSGRLAFALRDDQSLRYHGTDVVADLIAYARRTINRADWRFTLVEGLTIPEASGTGDFVTMFSVLTHLTAKEAKAYLAEAARVARPGGKVIVSFLDRELSEHRRVAGGWLRQAYCRLIGQGVKNLLLGKDQIAAWAREINLQLEFFGPERLGQSYVILTKLPTIQCRRLKEP
jgi:ubiquinone/menaquinone biosynthesis C-methylase UbiE